MSLIGTTRKVPIKPYGDAICPPIFFSYPGCASFGIRMRDLLSPSGMRFVGQGKDPVFQGVPFGKFYISWPGYSGASNMVQIELDHNCKAELALTIANHIARLFNTCWSMPCSGNHSTWRIGNGAVCINDVVLTALHNVGGDIWQAELDVEV